MSSYPTLSNCGSITVAKTKYREGEWCVVWASTEITAASSFEDAENIAIRVAVSGASTIQEMREVANVG